MIVPEALVGPEAIKSDAFSCIKNQINFAVPHRVYNSFIMQNIIKMVVKINVLLIQIKDIIHLC